MNGLTGISLRNGFILRPLLCIGREDILEYLEAENQDYVTDSSNLVDDVQRNKIRLNVLPLLENVNPAVKDNILTMARWIAEASTIVEASLSEAKAKAVSSATLNDSFCVDISKVEEYPSAEYLLWNILRKWLWWLRICTPLQVPPGSLLLTSLPLTAVDSSLLLWIRKRADRCEFPKWAPMCIQNFAS